ncbi:hypothetical protein [Pantoea agglomerans]|uniref:hypothetical protein n=1 Tax=Enterobacter agglomerans TaxID=549 RepID=UPI001FD92774|nr:hypothetical protein [Pantoea agglomerans]
MKLSPLPAIFSRQKNSREEVVADTFWKKASGDASERIFSSQPTPLVFLSATDKHFQADPPVPAINFPD